MRPMQVNLAAAHMFIVNPLAGLKSQNFRCSARTRRSRRIRAARMARTAIE
jgi:hypothetical protein